MNNETIEFFLHGKGKLPETLTALENETLNEVLARFDALPREGEVAFVGEADDALHKPDADEDEQPAADLEQTLKALKVGKLRHVHTRAALRIEVTVYFNGKSKKRRFSPTATIATVLSWTKKVFQIDPAGGADLVLALRASGEQARPDQHLGELRPGARELEFDLIREQTPQGAT